MAEIAGSMRALSATKRLQAVTCRRPVAETIARILEEADYDDIGQPLAYTHRGLAQTSTTRMSRPRRNSQPCVVPWPPWWPLAVPSAANGRSPRTRAHRREPLPDPPLDARPDGRPRAPRPDPRERGGQGGAPQAAPEVAE